MSSNAVAVSAGVNHSLFLKSDGSLGSGCKIIGVSWEMALRDPATSVTDRLCRVMLRPLPLGVSQPFLKSDGSLWGMGANTYGELGDGTTNDAYVPKLIVASGVIAIAAGSYHSLFLKSDGSLWGMGGNQWGQLGDGTTNSVNVPELIVPGPMNLASIDLSGADSMLNEPTDSGTTNYVLMSADVMLPKNQWTPVATNVLNANGNFGCLLFTNAVNPGAPQRFYMLQSP